MAGFFLASTLALSAIYFRVFPRDPAGGAHNTLPDSCAGEGGVRSTDGPPRPTVAGSLLPPRDRKEAYGSETWIRSRRGSCLARKMHPLNLYFGRWTAGSSRLRSAISSRKWIDRAASADAVRLADAGRNGRLEPGRGDHFRQLRQQSPPESVGGRRGCH